MQWARSLITGGLIVASGLGFAAPTGPSVATVNPWTVILGLGAVVGLILLLGWLLRRVQQMPLAGQQQLRISAALQVGTRERVVLVTAGDTQILLGVAQGQVNLLHRFDQPLPEPSPQRPEFAQTLQRILGRQQ